jgi:hypothetical protein
MLTCLHTLVHSYLHPDRLSILQCFRYHSFWINVPNLPILHGSITLPILQGNTCALLFSPLLAASLYHDICPSADVSENSSCSMTSHHWSTHSYTTLQLHPALTMFFCGTSPYIYSFIQFITQYEFIIKLCRIIIKQLYPVFQYSYLICRISKPCLLLIYAKFCQGLMLSHDFVVYTRQLKKRVNRWHLNELAWMLYKLCVICQSRSCTTYNALTRFRLARKWKVQHFVCISAVEQSAKLLHSSRRHIPVGGGGCKHTLWSSIEEHIISIPDSFNTCSNLVYMAHVEPDSLQPFPLEKFIHTRMLLSMLIDVLPLADVRSIVSQHG